MSSSLIYSSGRSLFRVLTLPPVSILKKTLSTCSWFRTKAHTLLMKHFNKNIFIQHKHYATGSKKKRSIKPPTRPVGIAGLYAEALFSAAVKMNTMQKVEADLEKLQSILKKDLRLRELLLSPSASKIIKEQDMKAILARLSMCPTTNNFMMTITENSRLYLLETIIDTFFYMMSFHRGEILCQVTTAEPLEAALKKKLIEQVRVAYKDRRTVTLVNIVDPKIIGGMVLKIDDYQIDLSIATRMRELTELMKVPQ